MSNGTVAQWQSPRRTPASVGIQSLESPRSTPGGSFSQIAKTDDTNFSTERKT